MGDDLFAGIKKKKSKKTVDFSSLDLPDSPNPTEAAAEPKSAPAEPAAVVDAVLPQQKDANLTLDATEELDFSDLKKKKKSKKVAISLEDVEPQDSATTTDVAANTQDATASDNVSLPAESADAAGGLDDFSDLKKKKKKSGKKTTFDLDAFEKELAAVESADAPTGKDGDDDDVPTGADLDDEVPEGENPFSKDGDAGMDGKSKSEIAFEKKAWIKDSRDYTYSELLGRFYSLLYASHPSLSGAAKKRYTIPPPSMMRDGNKRSIFANVADICKKMHRQPEHVIQFLFAELGTTGSVDGSGRLVIKGRFQQRHIENVLRKYIVEYVTCKTCKLPDTILEKDNRLYFVTCQSCQSRRSVANISSGFRAVATKRKVVAA